MAELRRNSLRRSSRRSSTKAQGPVTLPVKCAILGDGNVGKSAMLLTYLTGKFPGETSPGPIDGLSEFSHIAHQPVTITHESTEVQMTLVDTYGQDEYEALREKVCSHADVYILCYDVNRPETLERVEHQWLPEFRQYSAPECPFLVAGLQTDVRSKAMAASTDDVTHYVTFSEGKRKSEAMGAAFYVECTAKNNLAGVKSVFEKAAKAALMNSKPEDLNRGSCVVS